MISRFFCRLLTVVSRLSSSEVSFRIVGLVLFPVLSFPLLDSISPLCSFRGGVFPFVVLAIAGTLCRVVLACFFRTEEVSPGTCSLVPFPGIPLEASA